MSTLERTTTTGVQKAAILLSILGDDDAAPILRHLPQDDLDRVTEEVANLAPVPIEITMQVLEEYKELLAAQEFIAVGGETRAISLLVKAFGENGARGMVEKLTQREDPKSFKVDALKSAEPQQLARFLAGEHAQTKALVVGNLDPRQASSILMKLEPEARVDCIKRLATMKQVSPEAAAKASDVLNRKFGAIGGQSKRADLGFKGLAELMNRLEPAAARQILESIEKEQPQLATDIQDMMFTFENFLDVPETDLRELMNSVDKKTLMVALKGASEALRNHIYRTMSSRAVEIMKEDAEMMGPARSKDVTKAQSEIVAIARKLESEGRIVLRSEGDDEYIS